MRDNLQGRAIVGEKAKRPSDVACNAGLRFSWIVRSTGCSRSKICWPLEASKMMPKLVHANQKHKIQWLIQDKGLA